METDRNGRPYFDGKERGNDGDVCKKKWVEDIRDLYESNWENGKRLVNTRNEGWTAAMKFVPTREAACPASGGESRVKATNGQWVPVNG